MIGLNAKKIDEQQRLGFDVSHEADVVLPEVMELLRARKCVPLDFVNVPIITDPALNLIDADPAEKHAVSSNPTEPTSENTPPGNSNTRLRAPDSPLQLASTLLQEQSQRLSREVTVTLAEVRASVARRFGFIARTATATSGRRRSHSHIVTRVSHDQTTKMAREGGPSESDYESSQSSRPVRPAAVFGTGSATQRRHNEAAMKERDEESDHDQHRSESLMLSCSDLRAVQERERHERESDDDAYHTSPLNLPRVPSKQVGII